MIGLSGSRQGTRAILLAALALLVAACAAPGGARAPVTIEANRPNVVSFWNEVANRTVLAQAAVNLTAEERHPTFFFDLASVHVAIYDAVVAIEGRYVPFAVRPQSAAAGASTEAAVSAAAHGVLKALFPNRGAHYQAAYEARLALIPDGPAKAVGVALGSEVAAGVVRLRANDGRSAALAPYVSGTVPGAFRSANPNPVFRHFPAIRPFALERMDQFRPPAPPALTSASYAAAFNETRALGGATSTVRNAAQHHAALFHTEPPPPAVTRNLGRFASSTAEVSDAARLMALIYVSFVDAIGACFEAKYHYQTWRPVSAIQMADHDGNPATERDEHWKPALPTPNHPEYPAAHSCTSGSLGEALRHHFGTADATFTWDSTVTGTTRSYAGIEAFSSEAGIARLHGGMHFRFSVDAGEELGRRVAAWVAARHFKRRD
ncbi:MAG: vanadium-dependent haloperoxidase [Burkholderiales bacterium]|nr:vanadium-dependent haloperoxidase [Burkholderiales bacterium]